MKTLHSTLYKLTLLLFFFQSNQTKAQCSFPTVVGANVGVFTMSQAILATTFVPVSGVITANFCIDGDFDFDVPSIVYNGCQINIWTISVVTVSQITSFDYCAINGSNSDQIKINLGTNFNYTTVDNHALVHTDKTIVVTTNSVFTNIGSILFTTKCDLYSYGSTYDNAPITANDYCFIIMSTSKILGPATYTFTQKGIDIQAGGFYAGSRNLFDKNDHGLHIDDLGGSNYYSVSEYGSQFTDNKRPIWLLGADDITIRKCSLAYHGPVIGGGIAIDQSIGKVVVDQNYGDNIALFATINNCNYPEVTKNKWDSGSFATGTGFDFGAVANGKMIDNLVNLGIFASGFQLLSSTNCLAKNNEVKNFIQASRPFTVNNCSSDSLINNYAEKATVLLENYLINYCTSSYIKCNKAVNGGVGFRLSGSLPGLNFITNEMTLNTSKGLAYSAGTFAPTQISKGNKFNGNALGAEFEGSPSSFIYLPQKYVVRNVINEFPTHLPGGWFDPTSLTAPECGIGDGEEDPGGPHGRAALILGIQSTIGCAGTEDQDGACFKLLQDVLKLIEDNPDVLEDETIAAFYTLYQNKIINQLPLLQEVQALVYNYGISNIPYPGLEDTIVLLPEQIEELKTIFEANNLLIQALQEQREEIITELMTSINTAQTLTQIEDNYKSSLLWYLNGLNGHSNSDSDWARITDLANSCIQEEGPAIHLCQALCVIKEIPVDFDLDCSELQNRKTMRSNSKNIELSPNPVKYIMSIRANIETLEKGFLVYDYCGRFTGYYKGTQHDHLDGSSFTSGMYFIKFLSNGEVKKFIKI
ncbi:MAG: T9SS type A sorting domain-containing protein [Saprospiraceae bacterium]